MWQNQAMAVEIIPSKEHRFYSVVVKGHTVVGSIFVEGRTAAFYPLAVTAHMPLTGGELQEIASAVYAMQSRYGD